MKPLSASAEADLHNLYYDQKYVFGRDKLFKIAESLGIDASRRQIMSWLAKQEIHQRYARAYRTKDVKNTVLSKPKHQIGLDLIDMQNYAHNGYQYI
jgi:hypothetical protein